MIFFVFSQIRNLKQRVINDNKKVEKVKIVTQNRCPTQALVPCLNKCKSLCFQL